MTEAVEADVNGIDIWLSRKSTYTAIQPLAEDLLAAAASQAYIRPTCMWSGCFYANCYIHRATYGLSCSVAPRLKLNA